MINVKSRTVSAATAGKGSLWGSLASCAPIVNRRARRLATAAQDGILPHRVESFVAVVALDMLLLNSNR